MDEKQLFSLIRQVADMAFEYSSPDTGSERWLEDRRKENVNPFYSQTESGLFLELYYGIPGRIWTPWGQWDCWGSSSGGWGDVMSKFLERLGAVEHIPLRRSKMGEFGPVFALTEVDGVALPPAVIRAHDEFIEYKDARAAWENLEQQV